MANIVVIGAGLGGLPTAYELRHFLPSHHTVTVISDQSRFTFLPGLTPSCAGSGSPGALSTRLAAPGAAPWSEAGE